MKQQNYSNHSRYVPGFHYLTGGLVILVLIISTIQLVHGLSIGEPVYASVLPLIVSIVLLLLFWYARAFSVKVQDRAIRSEENLRHYVLTGKLFDSRLTMSQIIALRFAPDDEFVPLVEKAINERLSGADIKKAIKNWKADNHRA